MMVEEVVKTLLEALIVLLGATRINDIKTLKSLASWLSFFKSRSGEDRPGQNRATTLGKALFDAGWRAKHIECLIFENGNLSFSASLFWWHQSLQGKVYCSWGSPNINLPGEMGQGTRFEGSETVEDWISSTLQAPLGEAQGVKVLYWLVHFTCEESG